MCALGDFLVLSASVLRQTARYLPHHRSGNASKTHPKSSHDKFKTVSEYKTGGGKDAKTNMEATGEIGTVLRGLRHAHGKEGNRGNGNIVKVFQRTKQGKPTAWEKGGTRGAF